MPLDLMVNSTSRHKIKSNIVEVPTEAWDIIVDRIQNNNEVILYCDDKLMSSKQIIEDNESYCGENCGSMSCAVIYRIINNPGSVTIISLDSKQSGTYVEYRDEFSSDTEYSKFASLMQTLSLGIVRTVHGAVDLKSHKYRCGSCGYPASELFSEISKKISKNTSQMCQRCFLHAYVDCDKCYKSCHISEMKQFKYYYMYKDKLGSACNDCSSKMKRCKACETYVDPKYLIDNTCMPCIPRVVNNYTYKPPPIFFRADSDSESYKLFYGLELEVEMRKGLEPYKNAVSFNFDKDAKPFVYLKDDSSISCGFEIVSHPGSFNWWKNDENPLWIPLKKLTQTCESFYPDSTGIHIHVSRAAFANTFHISKFVLFLLQNKLFSAFVAERYNETHSGFNWEMERKVVAAVTSGVKYDRHTAVNLVTNPQGGVGDQKTIEIRLFKGNLKKERILKNIEFLDSIFHYTKQIKPERPDSYNYGKFEPGELYKLRKDLRVRNYKKWLEENGKEKYPHLWDFIKDYKENR